MATKSIQDKVEEEIIEIDDTPDKIDEGTQKAKGRKGQIIQKNYVLNDSSALKKKKRNETRKEAFNLGTEARDGSNMVIEMKTSFFEYVKSQFVQDILKNQDIVKVENAFGAKATTENSGDAYVEFSFDINF